MLTRRGMLHQIGATGVSLAAIGASRAPGAMPAGRTAVTFDVPRGACDCHVHVFGDPKIFPFAPERSYTPPAASVEELAELQTALKLDRVVIVQPSVYGADNSCTLDAIRRLGPKARGIAVIDNATSTAALDEMAKTGIRGVRLNLETSGQFEPAAAKRILDTAVERIRGRNWHIQIYTRPSVILALRDDLAALPYPVVIDHFGGARAALGPGQAGFDALLDLVHAGRAYVKISGAYRISDRPPDYPDATSMAQALIKANPDRVVWGTDWPHPNSAFGRGRSLSEIAPAFPIDDGLLLNELVKWEPDVAIRKKILVDNPARLYGFDVTAL